MPIGVVAAVAGAVATTVGTVASIKQQKKANRLLKQQYTFERNLANRRAAKERRDAIRAGRLAQAQITQNAANSGGADISSIALGAVGSIRSQINSNLSFLDTNQKLADRAGLAGSRANAAQRTAQVWEGVSALGQSIFAAGGGFDTLGRVFGGGGNNSGG